MMWTAIIKQDGGHGVVQFNGPHSFLDTHKNLTKQGYQTVALIKGMHPVATEGGVESPPTTITHIMQST